MFINKVVRSDIGQLRRRTFTPAVRLKFIADVYFLHRVENEESDNIRQGGDDEVETMDRGFMQN